MGDTAEKSAQQPAGETHDPKRQPPAIGVFGSEFANPGPWGAMLQLQGMAGNQAIARALDRASIPTVMRPVLATGRSPQLAGRSNRIQRDNPPNASVPPAPGPNQSVAPKPVGAMNNGVRFLGQIIFPDAAKCAELLKQILTEKGFEAASSFGHSFLKLTFEEKMATILFVDEEYLKQTQTVMDGAVAAFDEECRIFLETFEMRAGNTTDAMLTNAEETIHKEQQTLGMTGTSVGAWGGAGVLTDYKASNQAYLGETKTAAGTLGARREEVDALGKKAREAREQLDKASTMQRPTDPAQGGGSFPTAVGPVVPMAMVTSPSGGLPAFVPQALVDEEQAAHKAWQEGEEDFDKKAQEATAKYPSLGTMLSNGQGSAERLKAYAAETAAQSTQSLGEDFAKKLENIATVRSELGGRFSIWKQPAIISIVHQQMKSGPPEQRLVHDKIAKIQEDDKNTQEMYAAIALGIGLLAAIPTGGSSLLAGVAFAASVTGAAMSAYSAYQEGQNYLLQSATANTSLDRANQISQSEPSLLYLAIDIAAAIADLGMAKAAFTTLKESIAAAKAAKAIEQLPEIVGKMRSAGITPANQAKVMEQILPAGGDVGKALNDIRLAFERTALAAEDKETAELMKLVAEKAMDQTRVLIAPASAEHALESLKTQFMNRGFAEAEAATEAQSVFDTLFGNAKSLETGGFYDPSLKLIVIRGNASAEVAASILVHETTHLGQDTMKMMKRMGVFRSEVEAFTAQQQFLRMLPADRVAGSGWEWLVAAGPGEIEAHVLAEYAELGAVKVPIDHKELAEGIFNTLFQAGGAKR